MKKSRHSGSAFDRINGLFMILLSASMLFPFLYIAAGSLSSGTAILQGRVSIFPVEWTWVNYQAVFRNAAIWNSFVVTAFITVVGTFFNLLLTSLMAYGLARKELRGRTLIMLCIIFTMIFPAPLIPSYLLVKSLGMLNTLQALIVPSAISAFNLIIMISFFRSLPEGLLESARIDGAGEYRTWLSIAIPLSLPSITTIGLFYAVTHWNSYFAAIIYIRDPKLYPLQVKLRQLLVENDAEQMMQAVEVNLSSLEGIKMATIIVATLPILFVYPFIQKHFIKGSMLGSIKE
ncbi:protein LplC [Paenibacillus algicola]|uniref:Protein LplC n=1 Tax=Paenibacillus algicola TaxID=2565926 RepID=A0A4V1G3P6_9BACL|nr:carbohydrate ABC transporter permease [Paenibacillus algicola]QCT01924.1 protein LplC [Paenibacillus algicola]